MEDSSDNIRINLAKFIGLLHKGFKPTFQKSKDLGMDLTKNQVRAIMLLGDEERLTATQLGKFLSMEKGSITSLIDSLENIDLVYKKLDKNDRRKYWIYLTASGKDFFNKQKSIVNRQINNIFKNSTRDEINIFNENLENIVKILERNDKFEKR